MDSNAIIAVAGLGTMGAGIAQLAATAGNSVMLYDGAPDAADRAVERIGASLHRQIDRQRIGGADRDAILGRLSPQRDLDELAPAVVVIEAIAEDLAAKQGLLTRLEAIVDTRAILASNTSSLSITALAASLAHPGRCVGMHFFNPAPAMPLVEVVSGLATAPRTAKAISDLAKSWGKTPVQVRSTPGFIVNRIARPFYGEPLRILQEQGTDAATIDAIFRDNGFRMGPFELIDLIGLDVNFAVTKSIHAAYNGDPRYTPSLIQQELVEAGRLGRKSGQGFFGYDDPGNKPVPTIAAPAEPRREITVLGDLGAGAGLLECLAAKGVQVTRTAGPGLMRAGAVTMALTDGRTATARTAADNAPVVLFDLSRDYAAAKLIAIAPADQCTADHVAEAVGLLQAAGKDVAVVDDIPGLVLMRTATMLANEAVTAVQAGIAAPADIDTAMRLGMNFPIGPLAWAQEVGLANILQVMENLARIYGEDRYRAAPLLRRRALARTGFIGA